MVGGLKPEAFEAMYAVARECLLGTPMTVDTQATVIGLTRTVILVFNVDGLTPGEMSLRSAVSVGLSMDNLNAGGEALNREVTSACNRARTSLAAALRATAAQLEARGAELKKAVSK